LAEPASELRTAEGQARGLGGDSIEGTAAGGCFGARVFQVSRRKPILSVPQVVEQLGLSFPTVNGAVEHMERLDILRETTGKQRHRLFVYSAYLEILSEGTEPLR
jgi:hypothetical protein